MGRPLFRNAGPDDAARIAALHAGSWRRNYRGAYSDAFLDGDVTADRHTVWAARLAEPSPGSVTVLAEHGGDLAGFVHVVFDDDPQWGSLVDNLHVVHGARRTGIGTLLLRRAAAAVAERPAGGALYLWVLEQNEAAQSFYRARGGVRVETAAVSGPSGDPSRLVGTPRKHRMAWPDARTLTYG